MAQGSTVTARMPHFWARPVRKGHALATVSEQDTTVDRADIPQDSSYMVDDTLLMRMHTLIHSHSSNSLKFVAEALMCRASHQQRVQQTSRTHTLAIHVACCPCSNCRKAPGT